MSGLDAPTLERFVRLAGERLRGEWLVLGGTVIPLLGGRHRATLDIDLAGPADAGQDQINVLLQLALDLGLPVEAINQAAGFFLRDIEGWHAERVLLHAGPTARLYTPSATLYLLTKIERLTESDLGDCLEMLRLARRDGVEPDTVRLHAAIGAAKSASSSPQRGRRLESLARALGAG